MNTDEARQARMRSEARNAALAAKRVERISNLGIGRADSQRVSIDVVGTAVAELEREIDRLHHRLENQARTIKVQAATIARLTNAAQNPPICPEEAPMPTEVANVPREAVGVHPAPNVTIAERLGK
jgi:hypothetical protein